jgi:hypothetical protein
MAINRRLNKKSQKNLARKLKKEVAERIPD